MRKQKHYLKVTQCHAVCGKPMRPTVRTNSVQPKFWFTCKDRPKRLRASFMAASWRWVAWTPTWPRQFWENISVFQSHETTRVFRNPAAIPGRSCNSCSLFLVFLVSHGCICSHPSLLIGPQPQDSGRKKHSKKNDPLNLIFQTPPTGQQLASTHPIRDSSDGVTDVCDLCTIWCRYWMRQFEAPWYQDKQHKPFQRKALWAIVNSCYGPCACFVWHMPWT